MKLYFILIAILSVFMVVFPLAAVNLAKDSPDEPESIVTTIDDEQGKDETTSQAAETAPNDPEETIKVLRVSSGKVIDMELYDYLIGAVASEMSPQYEEEAIKAQAVACYTYAKWMLANGDNNDLSGADISDSPSRHQGYSSQDELKEKWGDKYDAYYKKIKDCVNSVLGEYMVYNNEPIIAVYHAISPGKTQDSKTVWGQELPYLKSVVANGDRLSPDFDSTVTLTKEQFKQCAANLEGASLGSDPSKWVGALKASATGYVSSVEIGGEKYDGNEVRSVFSLKSPFFSISYADGKFTFKVTGSGHGLGMSQYSADYMARQGSTYKEILLHFYTGVKIVK